MIAKPIGFIIALLPTIAFTQTQTGDHGAAPSAYAGEETRVIKSLSQKDLEEIASGGGWGLARAAELNGVPGPTHLLELADHLGLSDRQQIDIEAIRVQMQTDAVRAGKRFVAAEQALDVAFQQSPPDPETLERLVREAGTARAALRLVHLNAHLLTAPLLTEPQIRQYSVLRGYSEDPCAAAPPGHDIKLWRTHNGCE